MPKGTNIPIEISVGTTTNFRYQINELYFLPTPEKLIINPVKQEEELIKKVDGIGLDLYELLPHTPITAIGNNCTYELTEDETFSFHINFSASHLKKNYENIGALPSTISSLKHSLTLNYDSHVILNLSFEISEKQKVLNMNYHYQVNNEVDKIKHALSMFYKNYQHSNVIAAELISKGVK